MLWYLSGRCENCKSKYSHFFISLIGYQLLNIVNQQRIAYFREDFHPIWFSMCGPYLEELWCKSSGPLPSSNTSSYFPLHLLTFGMGWLGWILWYWRMRLEMDLYIDLKKLWGGWEEPWDLLLPSTISFSNRLPPPPSYSSQLLHPPPKPPPNSSQRVSDD